MVLDDGTCWPHSRKMFIWNEIFPFQQQNRARISIDGSINLIDVCFRGE